MATRRPRVKVAANLSIRRPPKTNTANVAVEPIKQDAQSSAPSEPVKEIDVGNTALLAQSNNAVPEADDQSGTHPSPKPGGPPEEPFQEFKLPKPVDDIVKPSHVTPSSGCLESNASLGNNVQNGEEPTSPRKQDARPTFTLPLARKRNRTESLTSNKSLPEGVTVNKVTRKVATKQEESQRTLDNKKEIRKRLTNIENVDKQNLTMFDMIYYNPVNNPMTAPALSKRGSLENIPKNVDGAREREGVRSRSVSKSRSPTPAPSGMALTAPKPAPDPVQLTPQLKLGPNGEMILDEASLVIENEREREMRETLANTDIVYQDEFSGNSGYYSRIRRTKDWDSEETIRFYRCLHTIGTDFSMMLSLFPRRSRRDLKLKFKKEERYNLRLVNKALQYPKEFNVEELRQQFAHEDEELERKKREENERKMEALKTQQKEQLQKKLMLQMSTSNNPQRKLSKSERAMVDTSETLGPEELKRPKRKAAPAKKRTTAKSGALSQVPTDLAAVKEEAQQHQEQLESLSESGLISSENSQVIVSLDTTAKESFKKSKRTPAPKKRATSQLDSNTVEQKEPQTQPESVLQSENSCTTIGADSATPSIPVERECFKNINYTSVSVKHETVVLAKDVPKLVEENAPQQSASVSEDNASHHTAIPDITNTIIQAAIDENITNRVIIPSTSPSLERPDTEKGNQLVVMEERKKTSAPVKGAKRKGAKGRPKHRRPFKKRRTAQPNRSRSVPEEPKLLLPDYKVLAIKKDVTEVVPIMDSNVSSVGEAPFVEANNFAEPETNPEGPFVLYEPAAASTYENPHLALPIAKYQCMEDTEDCVPPGYADANEMGHGSIVATSSAEPIMHDKEDDSITVITLQNLDDQTHTTCVRTDVGPTVEPTLINELTPVEIKYDEYDPADHLLVGSTVKREECNAVKANHHVTTTESNVPINVQIIDYPSPVAVPSTDPIPYMVFEKLEYASSSDTIIFHDQAPTSGKAMSIVDHQSSAQYASPVQLNIGDETSSIPASDGIHPGLSNEQTLLLATQNCPSYSNTGTVLSSPKHEQMLLNIQQTALDVKLGKQEHTDAIEKINKQQHPEVDGVQEDNDGFMFEKEEEVEENDEGLALEVEEEEDDGGFSLEDIDINSLVLVESQDSVNPNRTFYEIYVSNPDTGQLSEKPLDVPADVIESIRAILESGER
ncbi:uncharacterized protein LOC126563925 [Anopheles maculipalpis]|uniref:uncharacterized protein LOC126563925 n=1 Tax=Anopheles maculipalpis TaxID=1496333 RepID=UPI002158A55A|nr:uncharacterized protein LOC126563925 [Anopheles maculipalpis]